jgi:hypothetical protein
MEREPKWADVVKHCNEEIERLHKLLEAIQPEAPTNQLRGEIRALRRMLELGKPQAPTPPERMIQPPSDSFV